MWSDNPFFMLPTAVHDVWTASGNEPLAAWQGGQRLRRSYDSETRGYCVELPPCVGAARPSLPLAVVCPLLVLQVLVPPTALLSFELR
jgi:hypothetical protein